MDDLRDALEAFTREVVCYLRGVELPISTQYHLLRTPHASGYSLSYQPERRIDWGAALVRLLRSQELSARIPSTERVSHAVDARPELAADLYWHADTSKPLADAANRSFLTMRRLLMPFLERYLADTDGLSFDAGAFERVYSRLAALIDTPVVPLCHKAALVNVHFSLEGELALGGGVTLRAPTWDEIESWFNLGPALRVDVHEFIDIGCVVDLPFDVLKRPSSVWEAFPQWPSETVGKVVRALRLLTGARVRILLSQELTDGFFTDRGDNGVSYPIPMAPLLHDEATIGPDEAGRLVETWRHLSRSASADQIELALSRWDSAVDRVDDRERLIDYWIGLESLFTPEDDPEAITRRASQRIAVFLGHGHQERVRISDDIKNSYALRSKVVHGATAHPNKPTQKLLARVPELTGKTRDYLRDALLRILASATPFEARTFAKDLDDALFRDTATEWVRTPNERLGGLSPAEALRNGDVDRVARMMEELQ
ncbi:MAG: HEPN domain-containing protein [Chloroflexota bacterium]|nr:HEPN domain-containing protein [Chloroflexota bacterium]